MNRTPLFDSLPSRGICLFFYYYYYTFYMYNLHILYFKNPLTTPLFLFPGLLKKKCSKTIPSATLHVIDLYVQRWVTGIITPSVLGALQNSGVIHRSFIALHMAVEPPPTYVLNVHMQTQNRVAFISNRTLNFYRPRSSTQFFLSCLFIYVYKLFFLLTLLCKSATSKRSSSGALHRHHHPPSSSVACYNLTAARFSNHPPPTRIDPFWYK